MISEYENNKRKISIEMAKRFNQQLGVKVESLLDLS